MPENAKKNALGIGMALGAGIGLAVGAGIGVAMNDIAAWTPRGMVVGLLFGVFIGAMLSKKRS
jgi:F0F1-type ATP synthase assembly protein I